MKATEAVGNLLWFGFEGTTVPSSIRELLETNQLGGVTLFARNIPKDDNGGVVLEQLRGVNQALHTAGEHCLISVDQEGGRVQRVKEPTTIWLPALHYKDEEAGDAKIRGQQMGRDLRSWGFDISFAPVLDVYSNPENPIIGDRAFSENPERCAELGLAYADGLLDSGIIPCGKHFPGHGDTAVDSHLELPTLRHDRERLTSVELAPFREAVRRELPMLMTAHIVFTSLDDAFPATLSPKVITDLLRRKLGYQGVVVSDDLDMKAIADHYGVGEAAVRAINAGCDVLLLCRNPEHQEQARDALRKEYEGSQAFRDRVQESLGRIAALRNF